MAVLTYCTGDFIYALTAEGITHMQVAFADVDHRFLEWGLDQPDKSGLYPLLAVDDPVSMRGINYRQRSAGILLLVQKPFQHKREAMQAFHRVGRNGDKCRRQILAHVPVIDEAAEHAYKASLSNYLRLTSAVAAVKKRMTPKQRAQEAKLAIELRSTKKVTDFFAKETTGAKDGQSAHNNKSEATGAAKKAAKKKQQQ